MPIAVITFEFDPLVHLGEWSVRWETFAIGVAVLIGLIVAGVLAGRTGYPALDPATPDAVEHLRADDVLLIALGVVPGAVVGGRLAYVALHADYYAANGTAILDPGAGGLALSGAVVLGALTGGFVARMFEAPIGRWYGLAVIPMLLILSLGKAANILGGTGQGLPSTVDWATRYLGPGPWGSLGPDIPSSPAQAYEAIGVGVLLAVFVVARLLGSRVPGGRAFAIALGAWAAVRFAVAATWRDPDVLGPLKAEQVLDLAIVVLSIGLWVALVLRTHRATRPSAPAAPAGAELSWPDPETRHRF